MALRGASLVAKLIVFIVLARFFGSEDVGRFGLISATVAYGTFIAGMEFYNYALREVAGSNGAWQSHAIVNYIFFVLFIQIILVAFVLLLWQLGYLSFEFMLITLAVTVMEQWAQEGYRALIALRKPIFASVTLFLRLGAWVFFVIIGLIWWPEMRTLDFVLYAWLAGVSAATLVAGVVIFRLTGLPELSSLDVRWIIKGLPVAIVFIGAAFGLTTINFLDRVLQAQLGDFEALAAYVLFFGVSVSLIAALDAGVFSFAFPNVVAAGREGTKPVLVREVGKVLRPTLIASALFLGAGVMFFEFGLELLGIGSYTAFGTIYYTLFVSIVLQAWSMVPHLGLYALRKDRTIMVGNILALAMFLMFAFLLRGQHEAAVPLARAGAFFFLFAWKGLIFARLVRNKA